MVNERLTRLYRRFFLPVRHQGDE